MRKHNTRSTNVAKIKLEVRFNHLGPNTDDDDDTFVPNVGDDESMKKRRVHCK